MHAIDLPFSHLRLRLQARTALALPPYKGSTFRGAFGITFKKAVCIVAHGECARCLIRTQCAYPYIFDTPVAESPGIFRGFSEAPHPYVIEPPLEEKTDYAPGEILDIGLTVIGRARNHLPYFIHTFHRMGETGIGRGRGHCTLLSGEALCPDKTWKPVYDGATETLSDIPALCASDLLAAPLSDRVRIRFLTPTQLKADQHLVRGLDFAILVRGLLRRISALATFHGNGPPSLDFKDLVARAETVRTAHQDLRWQTYERYSNRKKERMKLGGFTGDVAFEGDLSPFAAMLRLGAHLHVGKGTSFGMGKYELMDV